ncbi:MAG: tyrosine-type recombinase/integrase [Phenylobacterium sp.]|uniref:tyrosine-type recombinase/integrase n=1 Tax=Phenylobacterium sp. TaxID=1871053 RepID=UPI001A226E63|nr:site-specific integrase [Phenylobacterium sp.]MBJ7409976.1 tyrosine-type recombinase/integrase [Phenylobacterium sp.]
MVRIGRRAVEAAKPKAAVYRLWDNELKGFGLRVSPKGVKTYFVWYRAGEGRAAQRREYTIARHGEMTPDEARTEAGKVLGRVRLGQDPQANRHRARGDINIAALCDLYLKDGVATKKESTLVSDKARIRAHIKPLIGRRPVSAFTSAEAAKFMRDIAAGKSAAAAKPSRKALRAKGLRGKALAKIDTRKRNDPAARGGKGTATRTLGLLGAIFAFAVREGMRADNPVRGVERFKDNKAQRFLSAEELARLTAAINAAEAEGLNRHGLNVIRLLTLTGARKGEIEGLRWSEVDFERVCLRLADSKTGARIVPLGAAALSAFEALPRCKASAFVFPAQGDPKRHYVGTPKVWEKVRAAAGLSDVRLHDLRHTFASFGVAGGLSLPLIAAILGHRDVKTTQQYAHLSDSPVKAAADRTAAAIDGAMQGRTADVRRHPRA